MSIYREISAGVMSYFQGCRWLVKNPFYLAVLLSPAVVSAFLLLTLFLMGMLSYYFIWGAVVVDYISKMSLGPASIFFMSIFFLFLFFFILVFLYSSLLNVVASPIYDYVSAVYEKNIYGKLKDPAWSFSICFKLIREEIKKIVFISTVSVVLSVIPVLNLFFPLFAVFLMGWLFYDFPCARWGFTFRQRLGLAFKNFWSIFGLGLFVFIPVAQFFLMPLAVMGALC